VGNLHEAPRPGRYVLHERVREIDGDPLEPASAEQEIARLGPNRSLRRRRAQDGRLLRRYRRHRKVERLSAWIFSFCRVATRYEYEAEDLDGFPQFEAAVMLLRRVER